VKRTSCLGTAKCIIFNIYLGRKEIILICFRLFDQPLLDYFWDISRDWERLQRTTTLHGRL